MDRRAMVFVGIGSLLVILALSGVFNSSRDVDITREEAVEIARPLIDFEPENADARLLRQGFQLAPVWAVSFSIGIDGNARDFERLMTVEIDASSGEVLRISTDGEGTIQPDG